MNELHQRNIACPYCGENIAILLDSSIDEQDYIEDCQVCCRPIMFYVSVDFEGDITLRVAHEDDA